MYMGGLLSMTHRRSTDSFRVPHNESCKRQKTSSSSSVCDDGLNPDPPDEQKTSSSSVCDDRLNPDPPDEQKTSSSSVCDDRLIPDLPDDVSLQILARIPRIYYFKLKVVSRRWKAALTSPDLYNIRKVLRTTEEWLYILMYKSDVGLLWHALDPVSKRWQPLPPIPDASVGSSIVNARSGCAIAAVDGCLYMLGGMAKFSSLARVWKYDPVSNSWSEANPMCVGRANFKIGVFNNKLFVFGGETYTHHGGNDFTKTPLQSAEVFDSQTGLWSEIPSMPCLKAHAIAGSYTPVAIGLASYRGKLYVPQSFYRGPIFDGGEVYDPELGEVYDPETSSWVDMPTGMAEGWPAQLRVPDQLAKPGVIVDGDLYAMEPLEDALKGARVYVYSHHDDSWKVVEGDVPKARNNSPYILTGLLGKLHVVTVDDNCNIILMRADKRYDSTASLDEGDSESMTTSESNIWNVIASGNSVFGSLEHKFGRLEGCQILDI